MSAQEGKNDQLDPQTAFHLEKLRLEVVDLKWKVGRVSKAGQIVSIITAFVAVFALVASFYQFNTQQELNAERDSVAYSREFRKPVWNKQLELFFQISEAASAVAASQPGDADRKQAEVKFWQLFYGPSVFVEGQIEEEDEAAKQGEGQGEKSARDKKPNVDVRQAVITFARCLQGISDECDESHSSEEKTIQLQKLSLELTSQCRESIARTWKLRFKVPKPEIAPESEAVLP
ncbi:MAG: hypothetical protein LC800_15460 [Acidobacteria bacterium]|nr:hypothetical protein [Acidobacteriota bacterium]